MTTDGAMGARRPLAPPALWGALTASLAFPTPPGTRGAARPGAHTLRIGARPSMPHRPRIRPLTRPVRGDSRDEAAPAAIYPLPRPSCPAARSAWGSHAFAAQQPRVPPLPSPPDGKARASLPRRKTGAAGASHSRIRVRVPPPCPYRICNFGGSLSTCADRPQTGRNPP